MGPSDHQPDADSAQPADESTDNHHDGPQLELPVSRRSALALLGLGGVGALGSQAATAQPPPKPWQKDQDANGHALVDLGEVEMSANPTTITDFEGTNLSIDGNGVLHATDTDTDTHTDVSDGGTQVVASVDDINFTGVISATDDGDGTASVGLDDDSISVVAGTHLTGGGNVSLGDSVSLSVSDDWVNTAGDTMQGDLDIGSNDLNDGGTTIWDATNAHIPADRIQTAGLDADTVDGKHATDLQPIVRDDGAVVVTDTEDINFGTNLDVTDDGGGAVTVDGSSVSPWEDTDSDGLLEAPGFDGIEVDFVQTPRLGTTDTTAFEGVVDDERFLRVVPTISAVAPAIIAGHQSNTVTSFVRGATIAGGGQASAPNRVEDNYGTVSGGQGNTASGFGATIGGGFNNDTDAGGATVGGGGNNDATAGGATISGGTANDATATYATVGGGQGNDATADRATVSGGRDNTATATNATVGGGRDNDATASSATVGGGIFNNATDDGATVGGGNSNDATGFYATVPGGFHNEASGQYSFTAGQRAKANNDGAFVWADSQNADFASDGDPTTVSGSNTFHVRTANGARFVTSGGTTYIPAGSTGWQTSSSRAVKTNVEPVDPEAVLAGVTALDVSTWEYRDEAAGGLGMRHIGPMAEDFHAAFDDLGDDDTSINSINADGVAFAAIQGLSQKLDKKDERIADLEQEKEDLRAKYDALKEANEDLQDRVADLEEQMTKLADS